MLIVASDAGVMATTTLGFGWNREGSWKRLGVGLPEVLSFDLAIDHSAESLTLRVGTYGLGVYELRPSDELFVEGNLAVGGVRIGETGAKAWRVHNVSARELTIHSLSIAEGGEAGGSGEFTLSGSDIPATIAPGAFLDFNVQLTPTAAKARTATVMLTSDASVAPVQFVPASGEGVPGADFVDSTPPAIVAMCGDTPCAQMWYATDVSVHWLVSDEESTPRMTGCGSQVIALDTTSEGITLTCSATSRGGTTDKSVTIGRDTKPPTIEITSPANGAGYPVNEPIVAGWSVDDGNGSGVRLVSAPYNAGQSFIAWPAGPATFIVTAWDHAGNQATLIHEYSVVDSTPPIVFDLCNGLRCGSGWYREDVLVTWSITDAESAITSPECAPTPVVQDTSGTQLFCNATSAGGTSGASVTIRRDTAAPVIGIETPADGASYVRNEVVIADWTAMDPAPGSGLETASGTAATGTPLATATAGAAAFHVKAHDVAGNASSLTHKYNVLSAGDAIASLRTQIADAGLARGPTDALLGLLRVAERLNESGRLNAAKATMNGFIALVQTLSGRGIPSPLAAAWISHARLIIGAFQA
jgi:hypothetical protein